MAVLKELFGDCVRAHRAAKGVSQAKLADDAGISEVWLRRIERGDASPSFETVSSLATALNVEPAELFGGAPAAKGRAGTAFASLVRRLSGRSEAELRRFAKMIEFLDRP